MFDRRDESFAIAQRRWDNLESSWDVEVDPCDECKGTGVEFIDADGESQKCLACDGTGEEEL